MRVQFRSGTVGKMPLRRKWKNVRDSVRKTDSYRRNDLGITL